MHYYRKLCFAEVVPTVDGIINFLEIQLMKATIRAVLTDISDVIDIRYLHVILCSS